MQPDGGASFHRCEATVQQLHQATHAARPLEQRFTHWEDLSKDPSLRFEMGVFDIGQFNLTSYEDFRRGVAPQLEAFNNQHADMKWCFDFARKLDIRYTPGSATTGSLTASR